MGACIRLAIAQVVDDQDRAGEGPDADGGEAQGEAHALAAGGRVGGERDGDPAWIERFKRLTTALARIAIRVEDRAYWPPESSYRPDGTWSYTTRGEARIPYQPPQEPNLEEQGTGDVTHQDPSSGSAGAMSTRVGSMRTMTRRSPG